MYIADSLPECNDNIVSILGCGEPSLSYQKVGNTSQIELAISSEIIGRENRFNRINPKSRVAVTDVNINLLINCVTKKNLIQSLYLLDNEKSEELVTETFCSCDEKSFIINKRPIEGTLLVVTKDSLGNTIETLHFESDYTYANGVLGIQKSLGHNVTFLEVSYLPSLDTVESKFFSLAPSYKDVRFIGKNYGSEFQEEYDVRLFRVLLQPIESFDLISKDEFFNLPLTGVVEESKNGYFKILRNGVPYEPEQSIY